MYKRNEGKVMKKNKGTCSTKEERGNFFLRRNDGVQRKFFVRKKRIPR